MMSYLWILLLGSLLAASAKAQDDVSPDEEAALPTPAPEEDAAVEVIENLDADQPTEPEADDTEAAVEEDTEGADVVEEDTEAADPAVEVTEVADPVEEDTEAADPAVEVTEVADPVEEDTEAADPAVEVTEVADPVEEDTEAADPAVEVTEVADPVEEDTEASDPVVEDTEATDPVVEEAAATVHAVVDVEAVTPTAGDADPETPAAPTEVPAVDPEAGDPEADQPTLHVEEEVTSTAGAAPAPEESGDKAGAADDKEEPTDPATDTESTEQEIEKEIVPEGRINVNAAIPSDKDLEDAQKRAEGIAVDNPGQSRTGPHISGATGDESPDAQESGSGSLAAILCTVGAALVAAVAGYFAYQKKKLCFKNRQEADPEAARKADAAEAQSDPQVLSNLLNSS